MNSKELLILLLNILEKQFGLFVVKDFIGFVDWEPSLGVTLLPYTGHHSEFCSAVKHCSRAFDRCVRCANIQQHICERRLASFSKPCFLGLSEYTFPIIIENQCVGSISVGLYTNDRADAVARVKKLCREMDLNEEDMLQHFDNTVSDSAPDEEAKAVFKFFANYISALFQPYYNASLQSKTKLTEDASFRNIYNYILRNYTDPNIRVATIAKACNYSPSYVSHMFKKHMKISLRSYINQLRIVLAKHELKNGRSVSYTAMVCGYNDSNYFCKIFHELVGVPPSQYSRHVGRRADIYSLPMPDFFSSVQ